MTFTAVLFIEKCTTSTITQLQDVLSTELISVSDRWSFELKTFRMSAKNINPNDTKVLHTLMLSHKNNETITIKNKSAILTPTVVPKSLFDNGCTYGTPEPFDVILSSKLSNIWTQRQTVKGESGVSYQTADLLIRVNNAFAHSGFQGLVIELQSKSSDSLESFQRNVERIRSLLTDMGLTGIRMSMDSFNKSENDHGGLDNIDLAFQYLQVLG